MPCLIVHMVLHGPPFEILGPPFTNKGGALDPPLVNLKKIQKNKIKKCNT